MSGKGSILRKEREGIDILQCKKIKNLGNKYEIYERAKCSYERVIRCNKGIHYS